MEKFPDFHIREEELTGLYSLFSHVYKPVITADGKFILTVTDSNIIVISEIIERDVVDTPIESDSSSVEPVDGDDATVPTPHRSTTVARKHHTLTNHKFTVKRIAVWEGLGLKKAIIVSLSSDSVRAFDFNNGKSLRQFEPHQGRITSLALSEDLAFEDCIVVTGGTDGVVMVSCFVL